MFAASKSGQAAGAAPTPTDPSFAYVPLLLNTTSTNGQQNNTFLDSSTNNFTITRNGTPTQGSITPYWPNGQWSNYFGDISSNILTISSPGANFQFSGDFTIEGWYWAASGVDNSIFIVGTSTYLAFNINPTGNTFNIYLNSATPTFSPTATIPLSQWNHVALVRSGSGSGNVKVYLNGTALGTTATNTSTLGYSSPSLSRIGGGGATSGVYISNLRVAASAVYTSNFTPPTAPLGVISGGQNPPTGTQTKLLACQSNRFLDNSTNNFTLTVTGTPRVQAFQPFSPTASYTTALYGGSGYFNGSTDNLSAASNAAFGFGTGDFTIDLWAYVANTSNAMSLVDLRNGVESTVNPLLYMAIGGAISWLVNGAVQIASAAITANSWVHIAVSRSSASTKIFINGTQSGSTYSDSNNYGQSSAFIGRGSVTTTLYVNGYLSNVRLVKGTAVYTGNFTPPTLAPLATTGPASAASYSSTTNVNTTFLTPASLLTNFTNAGIYDAAVQNDLITAGAAVTAVTPAKWSPSSVSFNGSNSYVQAPYNTIFNLGTSNFTVEFWVYFNSVAAAQTVVGRHNTTAAGDWLIYTATTGNLNYYLSSTGSTWNLANQVSIGSVSVGTWYYVALVRNGSVFTPYIGTTPGSAPTAGTTTTTASALATITQPLTIGASTNSLTFLNGYVQDFRFTVGVARSITTVPSASFPTR
jgi:hypothetical protein